MAKKKVYMGNITQEAAQTQMHNLSWAGKGKNIQLTSEFLQDLVSVCEVCVG